MALPSVSSGVSSIAARVQATVNPDNSGKGTLKITYDNSEVREYDFSLFDDADLNGNALRVDITKNVVEKVARYVLKKIENQTIDQAEINLQGLSVEDFTTKVANLDSWWTDSDDSDDLDVREVTIDGSVTYFTAAQSQAEAPSRTSLLHDTFKHEGFLDLKNDELPPPTETTSSKAKVSSSKEKEVALDKPSNSLETPAINDKPLESDTSNSSTLSTSSPLVVSNLSSDATLPAINISSISGSLENTTNEAVVSTPVTQAPPPDTLLQSSSPAMSVTTAESTPAPSDSTTSTESTSNSLGGETTETDEPSLLSDTPQQPSSLVMSETTTAEPTVADAPTLSISLTPTEAVELTHTAQVTPTEIDPQPSSSGMLGTTIVMPPVSSSSTPALELAKKTDNQVKLTFRITPRKTQSASADALSPASPKVEASTPAQPMLPKELMKMSSLTFRDAIKTGNILTDEEAGLIFDYHIDIPVEERAKLLLDLIVSATWVKAITGTFKTSSDAIEKLQEEQRQLARAEEGPQQEEKQLNREAAELKHEEENLKYKLSELTQIKSNLFFERQNLENDELININAVYKGSNAKVPQNEEEKKTKKRENTEKNKACLAEIKTIMKSIEEVQSQAEKKTKRKDEVTEKLGNIADRQRKLELELEKAQTTLETDKSNFSAILEEQKRKEKSARTALKGLAGAQKATSIKEGYEKEFEKQFFIGLSETMRRNPALNNLVSHGLERTNVCTGRWQDFNSVFTGQRALTQEGLVILGVEAREFLNTYLGALNETFENKPFVKSVCSKNKETRPFLTALIGEYVSTGEVEGRDLSFSGGILARNYGNPYFNTIGWKANQ